MGSNRRRRAPGRAITGGRPACARPAPRPRTSSARMCGFEPEEAGTVDAHNGRAPGVHGAAAPVSVRIHAIDVLRGLALFGVLAINLVDEFHDLAARPARTALP